MTDARTLFSLSLRDEASKQLKSFEGSYRQTLKNVESAGGDDSNFMQLTAAIQSTEGALTVLGATAPQVAAAMIAVNAASTAVDMARSAAESARLERAFYNLASAAGVSARVMMTELRAASYGMINDTQLMQAASSALALGVADSVEEVTALMQVAIAKGAEFGVAPVKAFNDLVGGLGRMSPEILNRIGIIIDAKATYDEYAQSLGVTADRLTQQQKMQALVNAVLRETPDAAEKAAQVGHSGAAAFDRWEASLANASDTWGKVFLPVVATGLDVLTSLVGVLGDLGAAMTGEINWTPEKVGAQIAQLEEALAAYQDPRQFPQNTPQTNMMIETAKAQLADLRAIQHELETGTVTATGALRNLGAAGMDAATGANTASAASQALMRRFAELASQANATQGALRSMWINAAGALGAQQAFTGWQAQKQELESLVNVWSQYGRMSGEQLEFAKAEWLDNQNRKLNDQIKALTAVDTAAGRAASGGLSAFDSRLSSIQSSVQSMIAGALSLDGIAWPGMEGPRQDDINENARRLAAIANEGLIGQDWLGEFAAEAPATYADLMLKIASGMDAQGAAQQLLAQFQQGLRPDLLDFDMIKQRVKDQLTSQQAIQEMTGELTSQLMAEMGVSAQQVQGALADLGLGATGAGSTDAGGAFAASFQDGVDGDQVAAGSLAKIAKAFLDNESQVRSSGAVVGAWWGEGFMAVVGQNVPPGLLDLLTNLLLPRIQAAAATAASQTGAP